jgi:Domain of unknown function (DUF4410)
MKKQLFMVAAFFAVALVMGFTHPAGAVEKSAQKTICILFDNGVNDTLEARQAKSQASLSNWMDKDLVKVFARYTKFGYEAKLIDNRKDFTPGANNYLLSVKIVEYNPGSRAARIVVGFGAGGVSLKIHYELFVDGAKSILTKDDSTYSGREWMNAARKLNQDIAEAVTEKLGK